MYLCAKKKISINWLLYNQNPGSLVDSTDKYWIRYYPEVRVSAGGGAYENDDEYESLEVPPYFINMLGGKENLKNIEAINQQTTPGYLASMVFFLLVIVNF